MAHTKRNTDSLVPITNQAQSPAVRRTIETTDASTAQAQALYQMRLFGTFQLEREGTSIRGIHSRKAIAMLCYLIVRAEPVPRTALAALFWSSLPEARALRNVTWAISRLDQHLPNCLLTDARSVRFQPTAHLWVDLLTFRSLVTRIDMQALSEAVLLYHGEFLEGFYLNDCSEFELWLLHQREAFHQQLATILETLILHYHQGGDYRQALLFADRLLQLDPWREEAHRHRMYLLALDGQRSAALMQYEVCCRLLAEEFGIMPSEETDSLYQQLRAGTIPLQYKAPPLVPPSRPRSRQHLETLTTSFVGRTAELEQLATYLHDPSKRLISIVGPGGIGKTRLALQLAKLYQHTFCHGVAIAELAAVESGKGLVFAIADVLEVPLTDKDNPTSQLFQILQLRHMLLILDNFEHLIEERILVRDLLDAAQQVTIIVTSRESLQLHIEHLFHLEGLPTPDDPNADGANAPAIQLFAERARQIDNTFCISAKNRAAIARICRIVEGNPLGIELAATWAHQLPLDQMADALQENLNLLTTSMPDVPQRHQSMRAVFQGSWQLLAPTDQCILSQLGIFRGGFSQEAAFTITAATMWSLTALANKSLVRRLGHGRYILHELLRQYAFEHIAVQPKICAVPEKVLRDRHSIYYLELVANASAAMHSAAPRQATDALRPDLDNIRQAWQWAAEQAHFDILAKSLYGLARFYKVTCLFHEAEGMFSNAAAHLAAACASLSPSTSYELLILARMRAEEAFFLIELASYDRAIALLQDVIQIAQHTEESDLQALAFVYLATAFSHQAQYEAARDPVEQALRLVRPLGLVQLEAYILRVRGNVFVHQGNYVEAQLAFEEAAHLYHMIGDRMGEGETLNFLGGAAWYQGDYTTARRYHERYLQTCQEIGNPQHVALALHNLADTLWPLGFYTQAKHLFKQALHIYRELGDQWNMSLTLANLGPPLLLMGNLHEAWEYQMQALKIARELGSCWIESLALIALGWLSHRRCNYVLAQMYSREGARVAQANGGRYEYVWALTCLGHASVGLGEWIEAESAYRQALSLNDTLGLVHRSNEILAGLARVAIARDDVAQAQQYVEIILQQLERAPFPGVSDITEIYQTCYSVLRAAQDERCPALYECLQTLPEKIYGADEQSPIQAYAHLHDQVEGLRDYHTSSRPVLID